MTIKVSITSMKDAERFSAIIRRFPQEITLRSGRFCVDPKSVLGVLAIMYSADDNMTVDTGDMEDVQLPAFSEALDGFIRA